MELFKSKYELTEKYIKGNLTFVLENNNNILGFYSFISKQKIALLKYLYIDPGFIGQGYRRILWDHMISECKDKDIKKIEFVTSPEAKDFYIKRGAKVIEYVDSDIIRDRKITKLIYEIEG